tara:strand:- start:267 stop:500 length:234 start_codon:yes stop_codon:yes gene_type:complete
MNKRIPYKYLSDADQEAERIIAEYTEWSMSKKQDKTAMLNVQKQNKLLMRSIMKCVDIYPELRELEHVKHALKECGK